MTGKRFLRGGVWLLLILLLTPVSARAQRLELVLPETEDLKAKNADGSITSIKRPTHKIHFKITPRAIDDHRVAQTLVWEFHERTSKNAAHSYMRAHFYLTEKRDAESSSDYNRLLARIWDEAENGEVNTDFLAKLTVKPITKGYSPAIVPEDELSESERLTQRRDLFLSGVERKKYDYAMFSLRENPEQLASVKKFVEENAMVFRSLEEGSRSDFCDFGTPFRETDNPIGILLPEVQSMRDLARALRVKIMLEIHEKRYEDAIASIRVGMALARHTGKQPTLICGLVGIAIQTMMLEQVQDMINAGDCPNLYWELSSLPSPFLSFVDAAEIEKQLLPQSIPLLRKAMNDPETLLDDEWRALLRQMSELLVALDSPGAKLLDKLPIKSHVMASYPAGRQWLLEQGKSATEVDAMIPEKVVGLHAAHETRKITDEYFRGMYLPLWESYQTEEVVMRYHRELETNPMGGSLFARRLTDVLLPAMNAARCAFQRMQLSNDIMRIAEALRDYAARHDGKLPESLDEITDVPVPAVSPLTGRPYEYQLIDGRGQIDAMQFSPACVVIFEIAK